jgi:anaerobic ribonucleoside-triphosphate reductase
MRNVSDKSSRGIKTHILYSTFSGNHAICKKCEKKYGGSDMPQTARQ